MKKLFFLFFALVAIATGANAATDYGFSIDGYKITSDNYQSMCSDSWSYDPAANVLYFKNDMNLQNVTAIDIFGDVNPTLMICVEGNVKISGVYQTCFNFHGKGNHTIYGSGTLTLQSKRLNPTMIYSNDECKLTVKDITLNIKAYGEASRGVDNTNFKPFTFDNCEVNIETESIAFGSFPIGMDPVFINCGVANGGFVYCGHIQDSSGFPPKAYIRRLIRTVNLILPDLQPGTPFSYENYLAACNDNEEGYVVENAELNHGTKVQDGEVILEYEVYQLAAQVLPPTDERGIMGIFAPDEDLKIMVNGEEATIYYYINNQRVTFQYTYPPAGLKNYPVWVAGTQVSSMNCNDVLGDGKISYDAESKTLTLKDATTITGQGSAREVATGYGAGIYSEIQGLTIDVVKGAVDVIGADECLGIYLKGSTVIKGEGAISGKGNTGVSMGSSSADLTVDGNVTLIAEGKGTTSEGLYGYARKFGSITIFFPTLTVKGNAVVRAKGELGSMSGLKDIVLEDNHAITSPAGAVWNADMHAVCDASGNPIAGEWVLIEKELSYDLNGDGKISTADIQVIINEMKKPQASQNMKYDLNGDGKISTADIQVIINEMKK